MDHKRRRAGTDSHGAQPHRGRPVASLLRGSGGSPRNSRIRRSAEVRPRWTPGERELGG
jgi:hypothetical protein